MRKILTKRNKILMARAYEDSLGIDSNTYIGIGRPLDWDSEDTQIPDIYETSNTINYVYKNLVSIKKLTSSDINLVVPRVDWTSGTVYSEYTEDEDLYAYDLETPITGTVNVTQDTLEVAGTGTTFTANLVVGDFITISADSINSYPEKKEVIAIIDDENLTVNSVFIYQYSGETCSKVVNSYPIYAKSFYVLTIPNYQVFKCLYNANGSPSTSMPEIDVGGSSPQSQYVETEDGYKWKYMYSIPSGLREKFFSYRWMPIVDNLTVQESAVDGRLDIFKISTGGTGYQNGGTVESAQILSVVGDGTGAQITANVVDGVIVGVNIQDPGKDYTEATVVVSDTNQKTSGEVAIIDAVIGPQNGHGFDPAYELGASTLMISVDLDASEGGAFPTISNEQNFDYRQVSLLRNVKDASGNVASASTYKATTIVTTTTPAGGNSFSLDDLVYQGLQSSSSTFSGIVCNWDSANNKIWLNDTKGTFSQGTIGNGDFIVTALSKTDPEIELYSGEVLYIENTSKIVRDDYQTEQIKVIVSF